MNFRIVEDSQIPWKEQIESAEEEINSEEFFNLGEKEEFSTEEGEDMWEDSEEDSEALQPHWTVEKIEKKQLKVKKAQALSKNILKYSLEHVITIRSVIEKVQAAESTVYLLDRTGHIYIYSNKALKRIEVCKGEKNRVFKDFAVVGNGVIVGLTKAFHSFFVIDPEKNLIKEINLYQYKNKAFSRIKKTKTGFMLVGHKTLYVYNANCILLDRVEMHEKVLDAAEDSDGLLVLLLESQVVSYCRKMREALLRSETLVAPSVLCLFGEHVAVGGKCGLSILQKVNLEIAREIENLKDVQTIDYMEEMNLLVFGTKEKANGIRMYNVKDRRIVTTFPRGENGSTQGGGYICGFSANKRTLYFGAEKRLFLLNIPEAFQSPQKDSKETLSSRSSNIPAEK